ncbi:MAG: hypothetical protein JRG96_04710 [Deltaproteobacteria bacterium]|nr:hypothetical protein [Deltaproteobacteria bacterium]MBW2418926.1 hypothetical protein [Deltaproteobacteria bacterium]
MRSFQGICLPALLAVTLGIAPSLAAGDVANWDQAKVTELAGQFAKDAQKAYDALYRQGSTSGARGSGQAFTYNKLVDGVRLIASEARHLHASLEKGKDHDSTYHTFKRIAELVHDAQVDVRFLFVEHMTQEKIDTAAGSLQALAAYYDPGAIQIPKRRSQGD